MSNANPTGSCRQVAAPLEALPATITRRGSLEPKPTGCLHNHIDMGDSDAKDVRSMRSEGGLSFAANVDAKVKPIGRLAGDPGQSGQGDKCRDGNVENLWNTFDELQSAIPGGTSLHPAVLRSMQRAYVNPWSEEFLAFFDETLVLLKRLYNTTQDVLAMIGPVRMAMDAVVCSLLEPDEKAALVTVNGHWSELFTHIARAHGSDPIVVQELWGRPIDPDEVRRRIDGARNQTIKALFVTHVETSTGVANPVEELGQVAQERGLLYVVDAAQTLGGSEVRTDDWGVDFCISGNHKCMSSPAGLTYVGISQRGWHELERRKSSIRAWYSNLLVWRDVWLKRQSGYFTFPTSLVFGLRAALDQMFAVTPRVLYDRYATVSKAIRYAVSAMGLELVVSGHQCPGCDSPGRFCADTVTAIRYPPNIRHKDFAQLMHGRYGMSIAGTYGPLAGRVFRVGPTGLMQLGSGFVLNLLSCVGLTLQQLGLHANLERALAVANTILADN